MNICSVVNAQFVQKQQNFKGNSAEFNSLSSLPNYQPIPLEASKAYASPQITEGYRELETFDVPYIGQGKLYELSNGHKIAIIAKSGPTVINTYVKVGHFDENANLKEISHLLEHLLANACFKPDDQDIKTILLKIGAVSNATTTNFLTNYYIKANLTKTENFEDLVKAQSAVLTHTNFTEEQIDNEKDIIIQELTEDGKFNSDDIFANKLGIKNLFNLDSSSDILANRSLLTIKNIKKQDLLNYYDNFYSPNNMVTTVVGAVEDNTIKTIAKHLGKSQNISEQSLKLSNTTFSKDNLIQNAKRVDTIGNNSSSNRAKAYLSFIGPETNNYKDTILMYCISKILTEDDIFKSAGIDNSFNITCNINSLEPQKDFPCSINVTGTSSEKEIENCLKNLYSKIYYLTQSPIPNEKLNEIKNRVKNKESLESQYAFNISEKYSTSLALSNNVKKETELLNILNSITPYDLQNTAKKYLDLNKVSIVVVHPQEKSGKSTPVSFKGNIDQLNTKDIHEYLLPNNLRVVIDSRADITRSTIHFDLHSQKRLYSNPEAGAALASFLASDETIERLSKENIHLAFDGNSQEIYTTLSGTPDKTLEMLNYAMGILLHPSISIEKFNEQKNKILESEKNNSKYSSIYKQISDEILKESPYHYMEGSVKDLTIDDVNKLHEQILENAQGTIFITIPKEILNDTQNEIFQTLLKISPLQKNNYSAIFNKFKAIPLTKTKIFIKTENDNDQIEIEKYFKIIESGNIKDRAGLLLLNHILGGNEKSKLFEKLRNENKIAYFANSRFDVNNETGKVARLTLSTNVTASTKNLHKVIDKYNESINELVNKPITLEKLESKKTSLKNKILSKTESSIDKNETIVEGYNSFYGTNYQQALFDAIDNMTSEYIQKLAQHYLTQPSLLSIVGNREVIQNSKDYFANLGEIINC